MIQLRILRWGEVFLDPLGGLDVITRVFIKESRGRFDPEDQGEEAIEGSSIRDRRGDAAGFETTSQGTQLASRKGR